MMQLIDGKLIAKTLNEELGIKISELKLAGLPLPGLVAILVGNDPASAIYVNSKKKDCETAGMLSKVEILPESTSETDLLNLIESYNNNPLFHGILVQMPLPKHINESKIINAISPDKDVDGFHPVSVGNLVIGNDTFVPCTPAGVQELLIRYGIETEGKHVVVLGRSNIVGKPIANIMLQKAKGANSIVTICHSATKDLKHFTLQADILIAAIGRPNFVTEDMVKPGVVIVDVGINRIDDASSPKGYRVVGDVDFDAMQTKASFITPVPGGVGLMTRAMLLQNTYKAYLRLRDKNE